MSSGKLLLGVVVGAAAGALLGILFAPEKGAETRKKIAEKGEDVVDEIKGKFNELLDDISKKMDGVKSKVADNETKVKADPGKVSTN